MAQLRLQDVGYSMADTLFAGVTATIGEGDRLGIVGANGGGKTTLLKCMAGLLEPTEGTITRPKNARVAYVPQDVPAEWEAQKLTTVLLDALRPDERDLYSWRVDLVLDSLHTPDEFRDRTLAELSGGWRRLAMIARAWTIDPDILLLDEPTTHLDLLKIISLETWLREEVAKVPLVVVSHDRRFLERCTTHTLFLRRGDSMLFTYPYSRARQLLAESDRVLEARRDRELKELQRLRDSAHNLRQIGVNNFSAAALRKSVQMSKRAEAAEASLTDVHVEARRDIKLASRDTHVKRAIGLKGVTIGSPVGTSLFYVEKFDIWRGDRVVVLGRNGTGKTCLVKRLKAAFESPDAGQVGGVTVAPSLKMGYIDQNMSGLPDEEEIGRYFGSIVGRERATPSLIGAGFPISEHAQKIGTCSAGQRARLVLLLLRIEEPNLYLMDEATNHLDITGQEQLEGEILTHDATAILVSHDRAFVETTGTRFVVVDGGRLFEIASPELFYDALALDTEMTTLTKGLSPL